MVEAEDVVGRNGEERCRLESRVSEVYIAGVGRRVVDEEAAGREENDDRKRHLAAGGGRESEHGIS